jgi:hypothetical protein
MSMRFPTAESISKRIIELCASLSLSVNIESRGILSGSHTVASCYCLLALATWMSDRVDVFLSQDPY